MRYSNRPIYQRRRRIASLIFVFLLLAVLYLVGLRVGGTGGEQMEQVDTPTVEQTTEVTDEQTVAEEETT